MICVPAYGTYRLNDLFGSQLSSRGVYGAANGLDGTQNESTTWKYLRFLKQKRRSK